MTESTVPVHETLLDLYPGGWALSLIPVCSGTPHKHGDQACASVGKRPLLGAWQQVYETRCGTQITPETVARELAAHVLAGGNVGISIPYGVVVLDCDRPETYALVRAVMPDAPAQSTGRGGHVVFRIPNGQKFQNGVRLALEPGHEVDLRTSGGQIVVEPSLHASGRSYMWEGVWLPPTIAQLPELPGRWAASLSTAQDRPGSTIAGPSGSARLPDDVLGRTREGGRHDRALQISRAAAAAGKSAAQILRELREWGARSCVPPYEDDADLQRIAASAESKYRPAEPVHSAPESAPPRPEPEPPTFPVDAMVGTYALAYEALEGVTRSCPSFVFGATLATLCASIGWTRWGIYSTHRHPNASVLLLGAPGDGKSGAIDRLVELLPVEHGSNLTRGYASDAGLALVLEDAGGKPTLWYVKEAGTLFGAMSSLSMGSKEDICDLLDCDKKPFTRRLGKNGKSVFAVDPHLSIVTATNLHHLQTILPPGFAESGLASRQLVFIRSKGDRWTPRPGTIRADHAAGIRRRLQMLVQAEPGGVTMSREADARWIDLATAYEREKEQTPVARREIVTRVPMHAFILALVYAVDAGRRTIEVEDIDRAALVIEFVKLGYWRLAERPELPVNAARSGALESRIREVLEAYPPGEKVRLRDLIRNHWRGGTAPSTAEVMRVLPDMEDIGLERDGKSVWLFR